jgi:hypothetical protein
MDITVSRNETQAIKGYIKYVILKIEILLITSAVG